MKTATLALSTAISLLAFIPVFADDLAGVDPACVMTNAGGAKAADKTKCPDGKTVSNNASTTEKPADSTTTDTTAAPMAETTQPADTTAPQSTTSAVETDTPASEFSVVPADVMHGSKIMTASDYIGKRVYDREGNDIGEVNDLIVSQDGRVQATILGVGGFLGMGEKNVAVPVASVEMMKDGSSIRLVVNATKQQLESAPVYDVNIRRYAG